MLTIVLSIILGYYILNLSVVLSRFLFHWWRAVWSRSTWFDMELRGPASENDSYSYLTIIPWFYEEPESHFSFAFTPLGFKVYCVPVQTIGGILGEQFSIMPSWQVLHDSARTPVSRISVSGPPSRTSGFSPGTDLIFFTEREIGEKEIERFGKEAGKSIVPGRLVEHVRQIFDPPGFILKDGNRWIIGHKDPTVRTEIITLLFGRVGEKVLRKNGLKGNVRVSSTDGADRFVARGQVRWWMKGLLKGDSIVIEGDGLRPGEVTSAEWALITIPVVRSGD